LPAGLAERVIHTVTTITPTANRFAVADNIDARHVYSFNIIMTGSAFLWCFAARRSVQAMVIVLVKRCNAAMNADRPTEAIIIISKEY
jgi:hypothetical protein